ncbi:unnamed protein product [Mesocestoides corti]|uniref:Secreted protein n=1 Tax=Mesocestoides corti TaxID=53468 RepID=A0A0R3URU6_MESCO|nr:unnamed protein product [Mesocestoides corti]
MNSTAHLFFCHVCGCIVHRGLSNGKFVHEKKKKKKKKKEKKKKKKFSLVWLDSGGAMTFSRCICSPTIQSKLRSVMPSWVCR